MTSHTQSCANKSLVRRFAKTAFVAAPLAYYAPIFTAVYALCGIVDVLRNTPHRVETIQRYFTGNGLLTWLLSPFNLLMDLVSLPYRNKGVYELSDLPFCCQTEVLRITRAADSDEFRAFIEPLFTEFPRGMFFFKWYGTNVSTTVGFSTLHAEYRYVTTIGVSAFAPRSSTSTHFGPLRTTLRVLYSINEMKDPGAFIEVGATINRWCDERLFIFDDTLQHRSCNETDSMRYCLFVDIVRPSLIPRIMQLLVRTIGAVLLPVRGGFYRNWKLTN